MATDVVGTGLPWVEAISRSFDTYAFEDFHRRLLPDLNARYGRLVVDDLRGVDPIAFRSDRGGVYTWEPSRNGVHVVRGDVGAATVVALSEQTFSDFLHELLTASGAVRTGRAQVVRGELAGWKRWGPAIQSLCSGREVYTAAVWRTLVDADGVPLDLHRRFGPDDDASEMRRFLRTAGYLHIRGVFSPAEVERFRAEVEHVRARTTPGDPFSWWSVTPPGRRW